MYLTAQNITCYLFIQAEEALRRNPEYLKYIENLNASHYFQGQVEGSELWKKLETKAAAVFLDVRRPESVILKSNFYLTNHKQ